MSYIQPKPIVKWAGGKSKLVNQLTRYFPMRFNNYHEPFVGGGAVFFSLFSELSNRRKKAFLSDSNPELINLYEVVRDHLTELIEVSRRHIYEQQYYYQIRGLEPANLSKVERASRLLYLNKTCFNGLWRVNSSGQFNVPFGKYVNPTLVDEAALTKASLVFQQVELACGDFEKVLAQAQPGDFVYLDPPYFPSSATANFTSYTANSFTFADHYRLREIFDDLRSKGCLVALSNSNTEKVRELYRAYNQKVILSARAINSKGSKRGLVEELLIISYPENYCRLNFSSQVVDEYGKLNIN